VDQNLCIGLYNKRDSLATMAGPTNTISLASLSHKVAVLCQAQHDFLSRIEFLLVCHMFHTMHSPPTDPAYGSQGD